MGSVLLIGLSVAIVGVAFSLNRKMRRRYNEDQKQQQLVLMFVAAGRSTPIEAAQIANEIKLFIFTEGWDRVEAFDRMSHATSIVKTIAPGPAYNNALDVWRALKNEL